MPRQDTAESLVKALVMEYDSRQPIELPEYDTLYIGGGTPSSLSDEMINVLATKFLNNSVNEFTLEANPEDVSAVRCREWRRMGINRLSMGVQSFCDFELNAIGRRHTATEAVNAFENARSAGFDNISLDLIYGLPYQTAESWKYSLDKLLALKPEHFSAYSLTVEPGSRIYAMHEAGKISLPDDDFNAYCFETLCKKASGNGYEHYEISNFSLPGKRSRHNSGYWTGEAYLGLGPSAYSFDGNNIRSDNRADLKRYLSGETIINRETESPDNLANDLIFTGLRCMDGVDIERLDKVCRGASTRFVANALRFVKSGDIVITGHRACIPERSWLISDYIIREVMI